MLNFMTEEEICQLYLANMSKVKWRIKAIKDILKGSHSTTYKFTNIEFCILQTRKILEIIALSSLVSDYNLYKNKLENIEKMWNAKWIIKDIKRINPNFFPIPVKFDGDEIIDLYGDYLDENKFISIYEKCGKYLHELSFMKIDKDYEEEYINMQTNILYWTNLIICTLNRHTIKLYNKDLLYINMGSEDDSIGPRARLLKPCN